MKFDELRGILKVSSDSFEILLKEFERQHPQGDPIAFLDFLHENQVLSEGDYHQARAEKHIDLHYASSVFTEEGESPIKGLKLLDLLGAGAMGEVRLAKDLALKRSVALKVIKEDTVNEESQDLFVREILITAQLDHPNIVPIYGMEHSQDGSIAYTMKLIRGQTLEHIIEETHRFYAKGRGHEAVPLNQRLEIFLKVCDALQYAHARGVLHRDLKPSNVMIGPFGEVYVMDWGIAKVMSIVDPKEEDGALLGTLSHISPEQARGELSSLKPFSDQYMLGLILQELVTVQRAIPDGTLVDMLRRARRGQRAPVIHFATKQIIRPELVAIINKSTKVQPQERYASVEDFAEDIRRFLREEPVLAREDPFLDKAKRWVYRHQTLTISLFLLVLIAGLVSNLINIHMQQQEREQVALQLAKEKDLSRKKEVALVDLLMSSSLRAQQIGDAFISYKGLLRSLSSAAEVQLRYTPYDDEPFFLSTDFVNAETSPKDVVQSKRYGLNVSLDSPVIKLAPNVSSDEQKMRIQQLNALQPIFKETLIRSIGEDALNWPEQQAREQILSKGAPIVWAFVATQEGIHAAYPGKGGYPPEYDPRERPWYKSAKDRRTPRCESPYLDSMGQGMLLPCTMGLYNQQGEQIGVAGLEFTFKYIIEQLLDLPGFEEIETFLVDAEGRIIVRSTDMNREDVTGEKRRDLFPVPEVVSKIEQKRSGSIKPFSMYGKIFVLQRMPTLGWYYVIFGEEESLLKFE